MQKIKVPATACEESNGLKFSGNWNFCVAIGRLGLALQREYLDHLSIVQNEIGFQYIRGAANR